MTITENGPPVSSLTIFLAGTAAGTYGGQFIHWLASRYYARKAASR